MTPGTAAEIRALQSRVAQLEAQATELAQAEQAALPLARTSQELVASGDLRRCSALGIRRHFVKPVRPSELLDAVLQSLGEHAAQPATAPAAGRPEAETGRPLRVLVAEDNRVNHAPRPVDGLSATREIRRLEATRQSPRRVPIVALTAGVMKGDREQCLAAGMDDYLSKPIRRDELVAALARLADATPAAV